MPKKDSFTVDVDKGTTIKRIMRDKALAAGGAGRMAGHVHTPGRMYQPSEDETTADPRMSLLYVDEDGAKVWLVDTSIVELRWGKVDYPATHMFYRFIPKGEIWVDSAE